MRWMLPLLLVGCLKPGPKRMVETAEPVRLVTVLGSYESEAVEELPPSVVARVSEELQARQLQPEAVGLFAEAFGVRRTVPARLEVLEEAGIAQPVLMVSCDPRFDTQVNGRFRWQVDCSVALSAADAEGGLEQGTLGASAHLVYYHQQEAEAVEEVSALVGREVGRVLDRWLATRGVPEAP